MSQIYEDPRKAMLEFNVQKPSNNNWFATIVERINDDVTDEEVFDTSVLDAESF